MKEQGVQVISSLINELAALNQETRGEIVDDDHARRVALRIAQKLFILLERPDIAPLKSIVPVQSTVLRIAVDLDLFNLLADAPGPSTINELAARTDSEPALMARILRVLDVMGYAEQVDETSFRATAVGEAVGSKKPVQAGIKHLFDIALPIFAELPEYFRKHGYRSPHDERDGPFQHAFDTDQTAFEWWSQDPVRSEDFNTFMTGSGHVKKHHWTSWFPLQERILDGADPSGDSDEALMVDLGGGHGQDLDEVLRKFPGAKGRFVVQDLPGVIEMYKGDNPRIEPMAHSFFDPQPVKGARVYFLHNVLHNWPDDAVVRIFTQLREAMRPRYSRILVAEAILPGMACSPRKAEMDWWMMAIHAGCQRTEKQFQGLCERAGLRFMQSWMPAGPGDGVIEIDLLD